MKLKNNCETPAWILADLKKSGLNLDNFQIELLKDEAQLMKLLGFSSIQDKTGNWVNIIEILSYLIPYPNDPGYYRLKLEHPIETNNGKIKYLSPKKEMGFGNLAYILPEVAKALKKYSPDKTIFITEGEKKAAKATLEGFPCIGLSGVWNWKDGECDFLPELEKFIWKNRTVFIVFDSDISKKHSVKQAELRLSLELLNRGSIVLSIRLPNEPDGGKNGLDDFIVRHGAESFQKLIETAQPTLELHIAEGTNKELILDELYRLKDQIRQEQILKALGKREGVKLDIVKAEYQKRIPKEEKNYNPPQETFTEEQLEKATSLLNSPDILLDMLSFTEHLGFIGEEINQKLLYLAFTSRLMDSSISVVVKGQSSSGKSHLVGTIIRLFPDSEVLNFSFVTSKALVHRQGDLSHKILYIAEHSGSEGADYSIRTILSEGEVSIMLPIKNEITGNFETVEKRITAKGLVFVETTTRDRIHGENQTRVFDLYVDESEKQTANILSMQAAQMETDNPDVVEQINVWRAAQSLLKKRIVHVPYAKELADNFPTHSTRARRDFKRLLSLICSHTMLYQHQRKTSSDGRLIATYDDLSGVLSIIQRVLEDSQRALSPKQAEILNIIKSEDVPAEFSIGDLSEVAKVDRKTLRRHLKYFTSEGLVEWNGERGKKSLYTKVSNPQSPMSPIGSFVSKIQELLEKRPEFWGHSQLSPNVPNTPITDNKGNRDNKGHSAMSPILSNNKGKINEINGFGDKGTQEHGDCMPSNAHNEMEARDSEDWETKEQRFLRERKKDIEL